MVVRRISLIVFILVLLFRISPALEDKSTSIWKRVNPALGSIQGLIPDRRNPGIWYVINNRSLYRSSDAGRSWRFTGITNVILDEYGKSRTVTVHPFTSEVLVVTYAGNSLPTCLWTSSDLGKTFLLRNPSLNARRVFQSPHEPNVLFAFDNSDYDLAVSQDGGRNWNEINRFPYKVQEHFPGYPTECKTEYFSFGDLIFSPFDKNTLYGFAEANIYCHGENGSESVFLASYNGGKSWVPASNEIVEYDFDTAFPDFVIGRSSLGLHRLTPRGWKFLSDEDVRDITFIPENPNHLIGKEFSYKSNPTFMRSQDGGKTWNPYGLGILDVGYLQLDHTRTWIAGTSAVGTYTRSGSPNWTPSNDGFTEADVIDVKRTPNGELFALIGQSCRGGKYLYSSIDDGRSWQRRWSGSSSICSDESIGRIFLHPKDTETVAIVLGNVYLSHNSGKQWRKLKIPSRSIYSLTFDPLLRNRIYVVGDSAYRSEDGGNTFIRLPLNFTEGSPSSIHVDPHNNHVLFFLFPYIGIYRSTDDGKTIKPSNKGFGRTCRDCAFFNPTDLAPLALQNSFLLSTEKGPVYKTVDNGAHWEKIAAKSGTEIYPVDSHGRSFYLFNGWDLFFTNNEGKTWANLTESLDPKFRRTAVTDPRLPLWYLAADSGLFTRTKTD